MFAKLLFFHVSAHFRYARLSLCDLHLNGMQIGYMIATTVVQCLVGPPFSFLWKPQLHPGGHCRDMNIFKRWTNFQQIVIDIIILIVPFPALIELHVLMKDMTSLVGNFCTGAM